MEPMNIEHLKLEIHVTQYAACFPAIGPLLSESEPTTANKIGEVDWSHWDYRTVEEEWITVRLTRPDGIGLHKAVANALALCGVLYEEHEHHISGVESSDTCIVRHEIIVPDGF